MITVIKNEVNTENLIRIKTLVGKPLLTHKRTLWAMVRSKDLKFMLGILIIFKIFQQATFPVWEGLNLSIISIKKLFVSKNIASNE